MFKKILHFSSIFIATILLSFAMQAQLADCDNPGAFSITPEAPLGGDGTAESPFIVCGNSDLIILESNGVDVEATGLEAPALVYALYTDQPANTVNLGDPNSLGVVLSGEEGIIFNSGIADFSNTSNLGYGTFVIVPVIIPDSTANALIPDINCTSIDADEIYPYITILNPGENAESCCVDSAPENDLCENATLLSTEELNGPYNNSCATATGEPCDEWVTFQGEPSIENSLWFEIVGTGGEMTVTAVNCTDFTIPDSQFALYEGSCDGPVIACNDDIASNNFLSSITFDSEAGQNYILLVDGLRGSVGDYCLELMTDEPDCSGVEDITEEATICVGDTYISENSGTAYTESGSELVLNAINCEYMLTVIIDYYEETPTLVVDAILCVGDTYLSESGIEYTSSFTEELVDENGCNYTVEVGIGYYEETLDINIEEVYNIGSGESYTSPSGTVYDENNPSGEEVLEDEYGCTYTVTVNLFFDDLCAEIEDQLIIPFVCVGESYISSTGMEYFEEGSEEITDANGCTYTLFVELNFYPVTDISVEETYLAGSGESYTSPSGTIYDENNPSGVEELEDENGCAYTVTVNLTFIPDVEPCEDILVEETYLEGSGESYTSPSGTVYDESNPSGVEELEDENGCIYTVTVNLTFIPDVEPCEDILVEETYLEGSGESYTSPSGTVYDENNPSGVEELEDENGCTYTVTVNLTFVPDIDPCQGVEHILVEETYLEGSGESYTSPSGTVYDESNPSGIEELEDENGCTYTVTVNLTFIPDVEPCEDILVEETYLEGSGESYTSPSGTVYDESNPSGVEELEDENGCTYTVTVNLTFVPDIDPCQGVEHVLVEETYLEGSGESYTSPSGTVYDESNPSGVEELEDENGCIYTVTVNLTFIPDVEPCEDILVEETYLEGSGESYTSPSGTVYDESNPSGVEELEDENGCAYTVTVNLTFEPVNEDCEITVVSSLEDVNDFYFCGDDILSLGNTVSWTFGDNADYFGSYILTDEAGIIVASNEEGIFSLSDFGGNTNTAYFAGAIAYGDTCNDTISLSGPQVVWLNPLNIEADIECDENTGNSTYVVTYFITGGLPEFDNSFTYMTAGDVNAEIMYGQPVVTSHLDNSNYSLTATDDIGCSFSVAETPDPCVKTAIEWLYFEGEAENENNLLKWGTAIEYNSDYFQVERSENGLDFEEIGRVIAQGESISATDYYFIDEDVENQDFYYRLVQYDFDGSFMTSEVVLIERDINETSVTIYPTIVSDVVNIESLGITGLLEANLFDMNGRLLLRQNVNNQDSMDIQELATGVYFLQVNDGNKVWNFKLIKQ